MAPLVSHVLREGLIEAQALHQLECYEAAVLFARTEGFIPAPETSHAIAADDPRGQAGEGRGQGEGHPA